VGRLLTVRCRFESCQRRKTCRSAAPAPMGVQAARLARLVAGDPGSGPGAGLGARSGGSTGPRSQFPAFVLDRGRYESFEASDPTVQLFPGGINNRGVIVGEYIAPDRESGFVGDPRGRITRIDLPRAAGTQVDKINDRGQVAVSAFTPTADDPFAGARGFVLRRHRRAVHRGPLPGRSQDDRDRHRRSRPDRRPLREPQLPELHCHAAPAARPHAADGPDVLSGSGGPNRPGWPGEWRQSFRPRITSSLKHSGRA
jgi:hypothetical protein